MTDVLISYARRDRGVAARLAACLEERGLKAVWDVSELPEGALMASARRRVAQAPAVVVLWSESALDSVWVCDEANAASARGAHVAASLDGAQSPAAQQGAVDLSEWKNTGAPAGLDALIAVIAATASQSQPGAAEPELPIAQVAPAAAAEEPSAGGLGAAIAFVLIWLLLIGVAVSRHHARAPAPLPSNLPGIDMDSTEPFDAPVITPTPEEENAPSGLRPNPPVNQDSVGSVKK